MHPRAEEFREEAAARYDLAVDVHEFDAGTETAAAAAEALGCDVGQIANSLVFDVGGDLVVAVTSGASRVSEAELAARFDATPASVSTASADSVRGAVGWSIGGVPPLCHERSLPTVFDPALLEHEAVWAACGTPSSMFPVAPERLRELADAEVADVTE